MRWILMVAVAALSAASVGCQGTGAGGGCCPFGDEACCGCGDAACGDAACGSCVSCDGCQKCGGGPFGGACDPSCCPLGPGDSVYDFQPGPPVGQVAYPYYTTRGPRDFLMANPPSIGPGG